ncbi:hypothetical protein V8G54_013504 [Vigna mungo]|uniref:Uncharacterized protein n=1 Tax=Vigna mungo TaxID=3915 RepID=A0AAQ3NX22_VIGMU
MHPKTWLGFPIVWVPCCLNPPTCESRTRPSPRRQCSPCLGTSSTVVGDGRRCLGVFVERNESSRVKRKKKIVLMKSLKRSARMKSCRGIYASIPLHNRGNNPFSKSLSDVKSDLQKGEKIFAGLYALVPLITEVIAILRFGCPSTEAYKFVIITEIPPHFDMFRFS